MSRDKIFQKLKKSNLHIDKEFFFKKKRSKVSSPETDCNKKPGFSKERISESIGKSKELWDSLKYTGLSNKTLISTSTR